jgi:hypothetical protein
VTAPQYLREEEKRIQVEEWRPYPGMQTLALMYFGPVGPREMFVGGARGPGKSWIQRLALARMAIEEESPGKLKYPHYKGAIFRYQSVDLRDWNSEAEKFYCGKLGAKPAGQPREYRFPGGPIIRTGHLADGAYTNYVGWEIHKLGIDEATHLPTRHNSETGAPECPDYQLLVGGSLRLSPDGNSQAFLTGNPGFVGDRWIKHRFIKVYKDGVLIPPRTVFRDPVSGHTRLFINGTVFDNPWIIENDPGYVKALMELSPAKQKAWIWGDWDAFEGQFFDFQQDKHVVDSGDASVVSALPPWCYRWISCDWGYSHTCAVHGFAMGLDKRIHVYKELTFDTKVGSFEVGVEIGKAFFRDIENLPDHHMSLYLSHDAFNEVDRNNRRVDGLRAGIQTVLGPQSCFILEMSADEKEEAAKDPDSAIRRMNARRAQETSSFGITIVRAVKNDVDAFDYMHHLLRTEQVKVKGVPDVAVIQNLRQHANGEMLVANYLAGFSTDDEVVPKILFHRDACPRLIETLPEMVHDEHDPEKMKKVNGDDWVDSALYGSNAYRDQQNAMPLSYYVQGQLAEVFRGREIDMSSAHLINLQARERWEQQNAAPAPMRLGRFGAN